MSAAKNLNVLNAIDFLIRFESGPDAGKTYRILPPKIDIGRDPSLQIVVTDPKASRKQFSITIKDNILIKDESSRKTTQLNGEPADNQILKPGDIISFGSSKLKFIAKAKSQPKTQPTALPGVNDQEAQEKKAARLKFNIFLGAIVILAAAYYVLDEVPTMNEKKLTTTEELSNQIEESKNRQEVLRASHKEKRKFGKKRYLMSVEQHFIRGFRDLQAGQYGRAMDSFGTTIATDQNHARAQQYSKIADKKKQNLIDFHMRDGLKYKDKVMYKRCEAEFSKAIVLINDRNSQKYKIAKTQLEECRLLKSGGF